MTELKFPQLSEKFLAWVKAHQEPRTWEWYGNYLNMFCAYPGIAETDAYSLKPYQVQEWIDSHGEKWGNNYRGGAVVAVKRVFNWAEEMGYGEGNPVKKLKKAPPEPRKIYMKPDEYQEVLSKINYSDSFRELFIFVWMTGCRPQEVRHIEARHVDLDRLRIVFPTKESKGKRKERVIHLEGESAEIIKRLYEKYPEGKLFRNSRGDAWTKYSICNRFYRIGKIMGKRVICYGVRHGFGTRKLIQKHDHLTVAELMGHTDGSMLSKVYSHIGEDDKHLKDALRD